jgi:cytochrome c556
VTRGARLVLVLLAALAGAACAAAEPPPKDFRRASLADSPEPFQDLRSILVRVARAREARDAAAARAEWPRLLETSRRALVMTPPHDLKRENVTRFLEGRARYSDALNALGRAQAGTDDAALWGATKEVEDAFWAWYDAYRGRPSEGAV